MKACKLHASLKEKKYNLKQWIIPPRKPFPPIHWSEAPLVKSQQDNWGRHSYVHTTRKKWKRERERNFCVYNFIPKKVYILHQFGYFSTAFSVYLFQKVFHLTWNSSYVESLIRLYVICKSLWILASKIFLEYLTTTRSNFLRLTDSADIFKAFGWV